MNCPEMVIDILQIVTTNSLIVVPASRVEIFVYGPPTGVYSFITLAFNTGPTGKSYPQSTLFTLNSAGTLVQPIPLPTTLPTVPDLRLQPVTNQRSIVLSETANGLNFFLDGIQFDDSGVDMLINLDGVEEWTIYNTAQEFHVFHIQVDFQVTEINFAAQTFNGYQDTVNLPFANTDGLPGEVKLLIQFTNPNNVGTVLLNILKHEDGGMAVLQARDPSNTTAATSAQSTAATSAQSTAATSAQSTAATTTTSAQPSGTNAAKTTSPPATTAATTAAATPLTAAQISAICIGTALGILLIFVFILPVAWAQYHRHDPRVMSFTERMNRTFRRKQ